MPGIKRLIDSMTLEEKASLLSGANFWNTKSIERLNIPSILLTDGPHGLRRQTGKADHLGLSQSVPATCFPTAAALANSWDVELVHEVGRAIGREAAATGVSVLLGPGLNIVRDPLAGRAFEYFSEDPLISGMLAASMVRGIQSCGVAATPKHFAVNSQEHMRMSIDEVVDERTLREIYLEGFRRVIQTAHPRMLMTSYNRVNGSYANENTHLLKDILKNEWHYKGAIVTDWGANNDRVEGLKAGSTLEMPTSNGITDNQIVGAVKSGDLEESIVDQQVERLLRLVFDTTAAIKGAQPVDFDRHHDAAVDAAARSIVLLKNDDVLPLKRGTRVAVIGDFAKTPCYQGAGSSFVNPTRLVGALDALSSDEAVEVVGYEPGFKRAGGRSISFIRRAVELAEKAEVALVFIGLDEAREAEGIDRSSMALPANQLELVERLSASHAKVVVVLAAGGAVELPFADDVSALVHGSLGGQGVGTALADVLTGRTCPSGKLAVSYPFSYNDAPTVNYFPGKEQMAEHREGLYVGYRYYETADVPVRYPFGFGLSYTKFSYKDIVVGRDDVSFSITNDGDIAGAEVAQVYVRPQVSGVFRPRRELKGFVKVYLQPGETRRLTVSFDEHTFAHYSTAASAWVVAPGEYVVEVAASVKDIRLEATIGQVGDAAFVAQKPQKTLGDYWAGTVTKVSDDAFAELLGHPIPSALWNRKQPVTYRDTVAQLQYGSLRGRLFYGLLKLVRRTLFLLGRPNDANNIVFIMNMPFSRIPGFSGGKITRKGIERFFGLRKS